MNAMQTQIVNRLVSARFLLENSGSRLNRHSDSRSVAHRVLTAHDAAELTISALSEHLQTGLPDKATFTEILKAVNGKMAPNGLPGHNFLTRLNKVRVAFKHYGELPDSGSWFDVIETTTNHLNDACSTAFNIALSDVDQVHLLENQQVREFLENAKKLSAEEKFKEALEQLSLALHEAVLRYRAFAIVAPGDADPEVALLLSGYGIDPSSFIALQQFLPNVDSAGGVKWNRHKTGHSLNWDGENARFCFNIVVQILTRLQYAPPMPYAVKFFDVYLDVLTINTLQPEVRKGTYFHLPDDNDVFTSTVPLEGLVPGDRILGRACACADADGRFTDEDMNLEDAQWLKVAQPSSERCKLSENEFLVIRCEHVTITFEDNPNSTLFVLSKLQKEMRR